MKSNITLAYHSMISITSALRQFSVLDSNPPATMESATVASMDPEIVENGDDKNFEVLVKTSRTRITIEHANEPLRAVIFLKKMWRPGQSIIVSFLDGESAQHDFVKKCWAEFQVNLTFEYVGRDDRDKSDVRITFTGKVFESFIGNTEVSKDEATMTLGAKNWDGSKELRAHILHEGMHMLGFGHEHASPNASIQWNITEVVKRFKSSDGWTPKNIITNITGQYAADQVGASKYDPKSIMHYPVDRDLTKDGVCVPHNLELSDVDKERLRSMYDNNPHSGVAHASSPTPPMASTSLPAPTLSIAFQMSRELFKIIGLYCLLVCVLVLGAAYIHKLV